MLRYDSSGYETLGKLHLAIINQEETDWFQVLLFQPKKRIVAGVNISSEFIFLVHQNNEMSFKYDENSMWRISIMTLRPASSPAQGH